MTTNNIQQDLFDDEPLSITGSPYWIDNNNISITSGAYATSTLATGTNGVSWASLGASSISIRDDLTPNTLTVQGDAQFNGNLTVGGINLMDTLKEIERRLNILRVDPVLEERWQELKELGDRYRELEAHILSKERLVKDLMRDYHID